MALKYTDANGGERYLKVARVVHNNNQKETIIAVLVGGVPAIANEFVATAKLRIKLSDTAIVGDSLPAAYAYLKELPEYTSAVNV